MKSAVAVITYNRIDALREVLAGLADFCPQYPTAIFEDCGNRDATAAWLKIDRTRTAHRHDLRAEQWDGNGMNGLPTVFLGDTNMGVARNSNRAIKWFMEETDAGHLVILNDDLHVLGDFVDLYARAHQELGVQHFCFCDFTSEAYRWITVHNRGWKLKLMPRFTGIMLSFTREILNKVGYFDADFGKFGEEHCDMTIRCRFAGGIRLDGADQNCLDVDHSSPGKSPGILLRHQEVPTSMSGPVRKAADKEASQIMSAASQDYRWRHYHRPFSLGVPPYAGAFGGGGIPVRSLRQQAVIVDGRE